MFDKKKYMRTYQKEYRLKHLEHYRENDKKYRKENKTKYQERKKKYREKNREKVRKWSLNYYYNHHEEILKKKHEDASECSKRSVELKTKAIKLLGGHCADCGLEISNKYNSYCFDFHHIDPKTKKYLISELIRRVVQPKEPTEMMKKRLIEELRKCIVLCAICHRLRTGKDYVSEDD